MYIKARDRTWPAGPPWKVCQCFLQLHESFSRVANSELLITCETLQSGMVTQEPDVPLSHFSDRGGQWPTGGDLHRSDHPALPFLPGHGKAMKWVTSKDYLSSIPQECSSSACPEVSSHPGGEGRVTGEKQRQIDFDWCGWYHEEHLTARRQALIKCWALRERSSCGSSPFPPLQKVNCGQYAEESRAFLFAKC